MLQNKTNSSLLEKLVARESLNTLILNLYPDKNEYSFALQMGSIVDELNVAGNSADGEEQMCTARVRWQWDDELLKYIDNEELPCILVDVLEEHGGLFYSGCVIVEVREHGVEGLGCQSRLVLLRPSPQSLWADVSLICDGTDEEDEQEEKWDETERLRLEAALIAATAPRLCLDPRPHVALLAARHHHQRHLLGEQGLRRVGRSWAATGTSKRRAGTSTIHQQQHEFILRKRARRSGGGTSTRSATPLAPPPAVLPAPALTPRRPLAPPPHPPCTNKYRCYAGPRDTKNCMPHLVEEYILDTDRQCETEPHKLYKLHVKLSILQRPFNSEYLGELYLDVDYEEGRSSGASSRFALGSRSYVDKFIRQFTDMLTKKGRKSMKIMKRVAGQEPKYICIPGLLGVSGSTGTGASTGVPQPVQVAPAISTPIAPSEPQTNNGQSKVEARHATNPEITALVASFISTAQQLEQQQAVKQRQQQQVNAAGNNAAILSLLNSSPINRRAMPVQLQAQQLPLRISALTAHQPPVNVLVPGTSTVQWPPRQQPQTTSEQGALSALLVNTPAADHLVPGAGNASALLERLAASLHQQQTQVQVRKNQSRTVWLIFYFAIKFLGG